MADLESLVAQLNQIRAEMEQSPGSLPPMEVMDRFKGVATQLRAKLDEATANLKAEIQTLAAGLKAKAAELRKPKPPKEEKEEPFPHPWEDHQGLDPAQLKHMIDSLMHLAKAPSAARH